jgi:ADP-ribose pyrophosphatase
MDEPHVVGRNTVFETPWIRLVDRSVLYPGEMASRSFCIVENPDFVTVLPITREGEIVLVHQWRPGVERTLAEFVGGGIDGDESPLAAAHRELLEETGLRTEKMIYLGAAAPDPTRLSSQAHLFVALAVEEAAAVSLEDGEQLQVELVTPKRLRELLVSCEIGSANHLALAGLALLHGYLQIV